LAWDLVRDIRVLDSQLAKVAEQMTAALEDYGSSLLGIDGIGPVLAVRLLGLTGRPSRFRSADAFASYTGSAPIETSSGERAVHRLSRSGDRKLIRAGLVSLNSRSGSRELTLAGRSASFELVLEQMGIRRKGQQMRRLPIAVVILIFMLLWPSAASATSPHNGNSTYLDCKWFGFHNYVSAVDSYTSNEWGVFNGIPGYNPSCTGYVALKLHLNGAVSSYTSTTNYVGRRFSAGDWTDHNSEATGNVGTHVGFYLK
jgi:Transposase IS116/IS110/IS902 family